MFGGFNRSIRLLQCYGPLKLIYEANGPNTEASDMSGTYLPVLPNRSERETPEERLANAASLGLKGQIGLFLKAKNFILLEFGGSL